MGVDECWEDRGREREKFGRVLTLPLSKNGHNNINFNHANSINT
jgi:hypothetical protein